MTQAKTWAAFDAHVSGMVAATLDRDSIEVRITSAGAKGSKLRVGKGINLPDALLDIDLPVPHSQDALRFAAQSADIVGLSFVSRAREVQRVSEYLDEHSRPEVGMIPKIETRRAFEHLPGMLVAALGGERAAGVMIARGDLAVECGYERLADVLVGADELLLSDVWLATPKLSGVRARHGVFFRTRQSRSMGVRWSGLVLRPAYRVGYGARAVSKYTRHGP